MGHPPQCLWCPFLRQEGIPDRRRQDSLRGSGTGGGPRNRTARRRRDRTHLGRSQRGPHRRMRDGLWGPQPHLDLPVHRCSAAGCGLPQGTGADRRRRRTRASAGRWTGSPDRCAGCCESGWKLAQVVKGASPESLLDTYHTERHPVAARVLRNTMAAIVLRREDDRTKALRDTISELLNMDEPRTRFAAMMSGLDITYDLGDGHPLLGRRMPDLDLVTASGPLRLFTLLHDAVPILLNLGEPGGLDITPWAHRVQLIDAKYSGVWELPVLGAVPAPNAVLIRP